MALFYHLNHLILPSPHPIALSANLCRSFIVRDCAVDIPFCFKSFCFDATFFWASIQSVADAQGTRIFAAFARTRWL